MFYDMTWLEKIIFLKQVIGGYSWQSDYETTPYLYRAMPNMSHYYNREIMEEVVGGSVGWNQLGKPLSANGWTTESGVTATYSDGVATITNTASANNGIYFTTKMTEHHKYLISCRLNATEANTYLIGKGGTGVYASKTLPANSGFVEVASINDCLVGGLQNNYIYGSGAYSNLQAKHFMLTDLTLALGSTIADYV